MAVEISHGKGDYGRYGRQLYQAQGLYAVSCATNKSSAVAEMGDRLATIDMDRKEGGLLCPFMCGELGPHVTQCGLGRGLPPYQVASPFGHNRHRPKMGAVSPSF